jgi:hypothetical protein
MSNNQLNILGDGEGAAGAAANPPHINVTQMSAAIASNLASSRQHHMPVFSGTRTEDPIKFLRNFERVAKALKWDNTTKMDKFPNYLTDSA